MGIWVSGIQRGFLVDSNWREKRVSLGIQITFGLFFITTKFGLIDKLGIW